jgi:integrase
MPTIRLTQLAAEKLTAPANGRLVYWDRGLPGFGLRITARGAKSWVAMYRVSRRSVMETLAPMSRVPKVVDARALARASMSKAATGAHPVAEKRAAHSVASAVARFLDEHCDRNLRAGTAKEWRRILEHDVVARWGDRTLAGISKADVLELINHKAARRERTRKGEDGGAGVQANRTLARLRTFCRWAVANDLTTTDPTVGVRMPAKETPRDRVLSDFELKAFWTGSEQLGTPFAPLFKLMALTAQREGEVAGMRWDEIDLATRTWTIPASRAKNGKQHVVHLSAPAISVLEQLPHQGDRLFTGPNGGSAPDFGRPKARLVALMGVDDWVLHDLRRTATTGMARCGIAPHVVDRILNHQAGVIRGVMRTYNQYDFLAERKAALEAWGRFVENLVITDTNVVPLVKASPAK